MYQNRRRDGGFRAVAGMAAAAALAAAFLVLFLLNHKSLREYETENARLQDENESLSRQLAEYREELEKVEPEILPYLATDTELEEDADAEDADAGSTVDREEIEKKAYSFYQGPWAWKQRLPWSGKWGKEYYDGSSFGGFGCGLVCMANIYSTLTKYEASPKEMYQYAKQVTEYGGGGAIGWEYMEQAMESLGMECRLQKKPDSYKAFRESIAEGVCAVVLVWSNECSLYWSNIDGHYVTIYGYDAETEEVFLADSGNPNHNRHWVGLDQIYVSLKSVSEWQYLNVLSYNAENCTWKHKRARGRWVRPEGF